MATENENRLDGKVFLVTGGTEGIGKAAATTFARRGATVVLVGRNAEKTARVAAEMKAASGNERVEVLLGDLSKMADIRAVAAAFKARWDRLDVLMNNAGGVFFEREITADGLERTFALNHISYFLLTHELLDVIKKTPGARVVSTSSGAHEMGRLADLDEVAKRAKSYAGWTAYGDSKLANVLFTRELSSRLQGTGVVANCVHPGFVRSAFGLHNGGFWGTLIGLSARLFARTVDKGVETLVWLATSPDAGKTSGEYFFDLRVTRTAKRARDEALQKSLWAYSEKVCGIA